MSDTFSKLNEKLFLVEIEKSFLKKGMKISNTKFIIKKIGFGIKFVINKDTILVQECAGKVVWKINNINKGELLGDSILDIVPEYEYEKSKDE